MKEKLTFHIYGKPQELGYEAIYPTPWMKLASHLFLQEALEQARAWSAKGLTLKVRSRLATGKWHETIWQKGEMVRSNLPKNYGIGEKVTFHGAFKKSTRAWSKAHQVRGKVIPVLMSGGGRYLVIKGKQRSNPSSAGQETPGRVVYDRICSIVAQKGMDHRCDAACRRSRHTYQHKFTSRAKIYGLPDGSLLIK